MGDDKRFHTCRARAALRGMTLHHIETDDLPSQFIATFHALTRTFSNIDELEVWIDLVEGRRVEVPA